MQTVGNTDEAAVTAASDNECGAAGISGTNRWNSSIEKRVLPVPP